jgi:hypothetical protein
MRRGLVTATVLVATAAMGCGAGEEDVIVDHGPAPTPYSGPLYVPVKAMDGDSQEAVLSESGAAGRALECDGEIHSGGFGAEWGRGEGGSTPEEGLKLYFAIEQPDGPTTGYRRERREDDRVLYSFDVDGRTKVAIVVAKDQKNRPGWGPETGASCDPAELPAAFTDSKEYEIWTGRDGKRVATTTLSSHAGAEHCDWQNVHFLGMGRGAHHRQYVRDPQGVLESELLTAPYDGDVRMPGGAHDTGYRFKGWRLWLTDDRKTAYVRTPDGVEAWPLLRQSLGCK